MGHGGRGSRGLGTLVATMGEMDGTAVPEVRWRQPQEGQRRVADGQMLCTCVLRVSSEPLRRDAWGANHARCTAFTCALLDILLRVDKHVEYVTLRTDAMAVVFRVRGTESARCHQRWRPGRRGHPFLRRPNSSIGRQALHVMCRSIAFHYVRGNPRGAALTCIRLSLFGPPLSVPAHILSLRRLTSPADAPLNLFRTPPRHSRASRPVSSLPTHSTNDPCDTARTLQRTSPWWRPHTY